MISPERPRATPSGFTSTSVRSRAIGGGAYRTAAHEGAVPGALRLRRAAQPRTRRFPRVRYERGSRLRDGRLAVRADLPERLERRLARGAGLLQLRGANGTDEVVALDLRAAHGALQLAAAEARLHLLDLELPLAHVVEVLRRAQQDVDEHAQERHEAEEDGHPDEPR